MSLAEVWQREHLFLSFYPVCSTRCVSANISLYHTDVKKRWQKMPMQKGTDTSFLEVVQFNDSCKGLPTTYR